MSGQNKTENRIPNNGIKTGRSLAILFIGNSHTYCNDMPLLVKQLAKADGYGCRVAMLARADMYLDQHAEGKEARFNILYGGYDYVVLQEHAHPFGPEERFTDGTERLIGMIREAGAVPVIYECWARRDEPEKQEHMNEVHRRVAEKTGALLAPVGEYWWKYRKEHPDVRMYAKDGEHATAAGSRLAAGVIWDTIRAKEEECV